MAQTVPPPAPTAPSCVRQASPACYAGFDLPAGAGRLHYYASRSAGSSALDGGPRAALVILHGHPRDANRSFEAALLAARRAGHLRDTVVIAPLFQVAADASAHCRTPGVPAAEAGDALWTCSSWIDGRPSLGERPINAFAALDALTVELVRRWPSLRTVTWAGFSAGAQLLQHSVGFAADPPHGIALHYVIADPGSWLYFDAVRAEPHRNGQQVGWNACGSGTDFPGACSLRFEPPPGSACPSYDHWKYGLQQMPAELVRGAATARVRYAAARIDYLEGALDSSAAKGTYDTILDKSCAAMLQGPFRLQRGRVYLAYERAVLHPRRPRTLTTVPGCAHDMACVLPSAAARRALFPAAP